MTRISAAISNHPSIHAALELSQNSGLLAIQVPGPDDPSLHPIKGGDAEGLMAKLGAARRRVAKVTGRTPAVTPCDEAGYDGFWLARFLGQRGIGCLVMEPASPRVTQGRKGRIRCVVIVALARKLAIARWRSLETGPIPEGAVVK